VTSGSAQVSATASIYINRLCGREAWLAWPQPPCRVSVPLRKGLRVPSAGLANRLTYESDDVRVRRVRDGRSGPNAVRGGGGGSPQKNSGNASFEAFQAANPFPLGLLRLAQAGAPPERSGL
jgi:hypothetical protein